MSMMFCRQIRLTTKLSILLVSAAMFGCTTINSSGEVVHHYFGYVKVIEPVISDDTGSVHIADVAATGMWIESTSFGLGYRHKRTEEIPLDCRIVAHLPDKKSVDAFVDAIKHMKENGENICAILDSNI